MNTDQRILWVNPSFLDYRIPLYDELNKKLDGNFHLIYGKDKIPTRCHDHVVEKLRENAHYLEKGKKYHFGSPVSEFANSSLTINIPSGLYGMIKGVKPDAIISEGFFQYTPWAVWYSFIHRKPLYIAYERTAHTERNCPWWRKLYRKFIRMFVDGYIANGQLTKEYLISQGVKPEKIFTGGMCADSEGLRNNVNGLSNKEKESFASSIHLHECKGVRYIYVGQIVARKGVKYLLNAWRKHINNHPEDQLLIVGDGKFLPEYKEKFKELESIIFYGKVDYSIIYKYYAVSDVFVIPTLEDNWSLVVPEAMACKLPIACSIYNGCHPELVKKDYNGITFDPLEENSVLLALDYFHHINLEEFAINSCELEKMYSPERIADNVIEMLTKLDAKK